MIVLFLRNFIWLTTMVVTMLVASCEEDEVILPPAKPKITVHDPAPNDTVSASGGQVHIEFVASDDDNLKSLDVRVKDQNDSVWYADAPAVSGLKSYSYHQHFSPVVASTRALTLTIICVDARIDSAVAVVPFWVEP